VICGEEVLTIIKRYENAMTVYAGDPLTSMVTFLSPPTPSGTYV
jgi:hypothetical protein